MTTEHFQSVSAGRRSGVSVWKQIADTLGSEIRDRAFSSTGRLPSENELATRFGVNRHTLRQAVGALQLDGLVRIEPGRGTFVQHELLTTRSRGVPASVRTCSARGCCPANSC